MKIPFAKPEIGLKEKQAVRDVLNGNILVHGPKAKDFENSFKKYTKSNNAISVSSCTAGMHLIYFALGIGKGDEVIVPAQTHVATAHAVELTGAKAVFVDVDINTGNICYENIIKKVNGKTKAIAVVHYLGVPVEMAKISKLAKSKNIFLLEDCALSLGASYKNKHTGLIGDAGVFSFYPVKHITSGEGGMIITSNDKLSKKLKLLKAFGIDRDHSERKVAGMYDSTILGFNYRMSEIHAAIGIEQIKKINKFLYLRKRNFLILKNNIHTDEEKFNILPQLQNRTIKSSHYCLSLVLSKNLSKKRESIINSLKNNGIGVSIYYPQPVPRMTYYKKKYGYKPNNFPSAEQISDCSIALPVGPHISEKNAHFIANNLNKILSKI